MKQHTALILVWAGVLLPAITAYPQTTLSLGWTVRGGTLYPTRAKADADVWDDVLVQTRISVDAEVEKSKVRSLETMNVVLDLPISKQVQEKADQFLVVMDNRAYLIDEKWKLVPLLEGKLVSDCIVHPPSKQVACLEEKAGRETPATFRTLAISTLDGSAAVQRIALPLRATELLSWSPDGRFVIGGFFYPELENKPEQEGDPFRVGAIDTLTGQVLKSVIPGLIDSIVWLDNTRAILSFHAGPDAGAWLVGITHANLTSRKFQGWETQEGSQGNQWRYKAVNQLPGGEVIGLQWKVSKQYPGVREELKFEWIVISTQTPYQVRRLAALNMGSLPCCENWPDLPVLDASVDPSKVWGVIAFPHFRGGLGYAVCDLENGQTTATNIPATGEVFYYSIGELYFTMAVGTQYAVIGTSSGLYRLDRNGKSAFLAQGKVSRVQLIATDFLTEEEKIR